MCVGVYGDDIVCCGWGASGGYVGGYGCGVGDGGTGITVVVGGRGGGVVMYVCCCYCGVSCC